jgi:hypothetical protein
MYSIEFILNSCNNFFLFVLLDWYNALFILVVLAIVLLALIRPRITANWLFSCLILLSALFAVLRPFSMFHHYMIFFSIPALLFFITTLQIIFHNTSFPIKLKYVDKLSLFFKKENKLVAILLISWIFIFDGFASNVKNQLLATNFLVGNKKNFSDISRMIMQQTSPDDYILVWGWEMRIHVYTNRRSATAQGDIARIWGNTDRLIWGNKYPLKNISNYINDIKRNKPKLIIDVVAPGSFYFNEDIYALENHTEVWATVKDDYELTTVYPVEGGSYKIYTRKQQ